MCAALQLAEKPPHPPALEQAAVDSAWRARHLRLVSCGQAWAKRSKQSNEPSWPLEKTQLDAACEVPTNPLEILIKRNKESTAYITSTLSRNNNMENKKYQARPNELESSNADSGAGNLRPSRKNPQRHPGALTF
jgi:hypothetical protein